MEPRRQDRLQWPPARRLRLRGYSRHADDQANDDQAGAHGHGHRQAHARPERRQRLMQQVVLCQQRRRMPDRRRQVQDHPGQLVSFSTLPFSHSYCGALGK